MVCQPNIFLFQISPLIFFYLATFFNQNFINSFSLRKFNFRSYGSHDSSTVLFDRTRFENLKVEMTVKFDESFAIVEACPAYIKTSLSRPITGIQWGEVSTQNRAGVFVSEILNSRSIAVKMSGIEVNDRLLFVQDTDVQYFSLEEVLAVIDAVPSGRKVSLTFRRGGAYQTLQPPQGWQDPREHQVRDPSDFGACSFQGMRQTQEDSLILFTFAIIPPNQAPFCLFVGGVFDGHCGPECSSAASKVLPGVVKEIMVRYYDLNIGLISELVWDALRQHPDVTSVAKGGSTANIVLFRDDGSLSFVNCGDSRAIISSLSTIFRTVSVPFKTIDHSASNKEEIRRVGTEGGEVYCDASKCWVLCGDTRLSVTRNIGSSKWRKYAVINEADISERRLEKDNKAIIIASDGVWSRLENSAVASFIQGCRNRGVDASTAACNLCEYALENGSTDNISAVVLYL